MIPQGGKFDCPSTDSEEDLSAMGLTWVADRNIDFSEEHWSLFHKNLKKRCQDNRKQNFFSLNYCTEFIGPHAGHTEQGCGRMKGVGGVNDGTLVHVCYGAVHRSSGLISMTI